MLEYSAVVIFNERRKDYLQWILEKCNVWPEQVVLTSSEANHLMFFLKQVLKKAVVLPES